MSRCEMWRGDKCSVYWLWHLRWPVQDAPLIQAAQRVMAGYDPGYGPLYSTAPGYYGGGAVFGLGVGGGWRGRNWHGDGSHWHGHSGWHGGEHHGGSWHGGGGGGHRSGGHGGGWHH